MYKGNLYLYLFINLLHVLYKCIICVSFHKYEYIFAWYIFPVLSVEKILENKWNFFNHAFKKAFADLKEHQCT